jgi:hypothetical protein
VSSAGARCVPGPGVDDQKLTETLKL